MNQPYCLAIRRSNQWLLKPLYLAGLTLLWFILTGLPAFAQDDLPLAPLSAPPLYGNYCTATGGIGLYPNDGSGQFSVNVPGTPIATYWYWSGRSSSAPNENDNDIIISLNGGPNQTITASQSSTSGVIRRYYWHGNLFVDASASLALPNATTTYTVSGLDVNGPNPPTPENHGVGVIVVYESPSCPFQKLEFTFGNDAFHHTWGGDFGPDSGLYCATFDATSTTREMTIDMVVGGVADATRGNSVWYSTGSGPAPTGNLTPDIANNPNLNATEIVDPFNIGSGMEWDIYSSAPITINAGDTYACFQIESPEDDNGISGTWLGTATALPVAPPSIDIIKSPDLQTVASGSTVTFTIQVENTSPYTLTDVTVTDALVPDCGSSIGTLGPGEIHPAYTCTIDNVLDSFTNEATVTGQPPFGAPVEDTDTAEVVVQNPAIAISKTPDLQELTLGSTAEFTIVVTNTGDVTLSNVTVTDLLAPDCSQALGTMVPNDVQTYTCSLDNVTTSFTNSATVVGTPPNGDPVEDTDTAEVIVGTPAIDIIKTPDIQSVVAGSTVTFSIRVENIGDIILYDVAVTDIETPNCDRVLGTMAPAAVEIYECSLDNVTASFTNIADVIGQSADGTIVEDSDPADVTILGPAIDIEKTPDSQTVRFGEAVTFTIRVENTGELDLTNVNVTDTLAPQCNNSFTALAVGEVETYTCTVANVEADFVNTADVSGQPPSGPPVTDTDDAAVDVVLPVIEISKTPDSQVVLAGQPVTFNIIVTNTGDTLLGGVDLFNVVVTDELAPQCNASLGDLAAGQSTSYSCTIPIVEASFTNIAVATGTPSVGGEDVSDSDSADVIVVRPDIDINKTPDLQTVAAGSTVTFDIQVENTGSVTLTNVTVTDAQAPSCDRDLGTMAPGEIEQYSCTLDNVTADFTNVAQVVGTPMLDASMGQVDDVTDTDDAAVDVTTPAITIIKTPDLQVATSGSSVDFNITVQNTGDVALFQVAVTDAVAPNCDRQIGDLNPGQSMSYQCILNDVRSDLINVATVVGQPAVGDPVSDEDDAVVDLISPAITIEKSVEDAQIEPGGTATFSIRVENTGDVVLTDVVVTDQIAPQCNTEIGTLNPAESRLYTCELPNVLEGLVNVAEVVGVPPSGPNVTDEDDAEVFIPPADLFISKSDGGVQTQPGGQIRYSLVYENRGEGDAFNVIITEIVPANTTFNAAESDPAWNCADNSIAPGTSCTYDVGTLRAGESGTVDLIFTVDVSPQLPVTVTRIDNVVTIGGRNNVLVTGALSAEDNTPIAPTALEEESEPTKALQQSIFIPLFEGLR